MAQARADDHDDATAAVQSKARRCTLRRRRRRRRRRRLRRRSQPWPREQRTTAVWSKGRSNCRTWQLCRPCRFQPDRLQCSRRPLRPCRHRTKTQLGRLHPLYFPRYYVTCRGSLPRGKKHEKLAPAQPKGAELGPSFKRAQAKRLPQGALLAERHARGPDGQPMTTLPQAQAGRGELKPCRIESTRVAQRIAM